MGKWTRNLLIFAVILFISGIGCVIGGFVSGVTSGDLQAFFEKYTNQIEEIPFFYKEEEENVTFTDQETKESFYSFSKEEISSLDLEVTNADIRIAASTDEKIHVNVTTGYEEGLKVGESQRVLSIHFDQEIWKKEKTTIDIYLPSELEWKEIDMKIGAGNCVLETPVFFEEWNMECGAASFESLKTMNGKRFHLENGAGKVFVSYLQASDISVENGAGVVELLVSGTKDQYEAKIEIAAGKVTYDDRVFSGMAKEYHLKSKDAVGKMDIECAAGSMTVTFKEVI